MIPIPSDVQELLESGQLITRLMIQFDLDDGSQGLWNDEYDVVANGVTFQGIGGNMDTDAFSGSADLNVQNCVFRISGLGPQIHTIIDTLEWHQRPATVFIALLDDARTIRFMLTRYSGFLDAAPLEDAGDGTSILSVTIENNNRELDRASGRKRSDADQRSIGGANDGFYKYLGQANSNVSLPWGRKGAQSPVN